jgi:hypothetical protein
VLLPSSVVAAVDFAPPAVSVVAVVLSPVFVVSVAVDKFGRFVGSAADCADAPIARRETASAAERSDFFCRSLIIYVLSNYCVKI